MNTEKLQQSRHLLQTLLNYCVSHDMVMCLQKQDITYSLRRMNEYNVQVTDRVESLHDDAIINQAIIEQVEKLNLVVAGEAKNCTIIPHSQWREKNQEKHAHLMVEMFWSTQRETFEEFAQSWISRGLNLTYAYDYTNATYPHGFSDRQVVPYSKGRNWRHLIGCLPKKPLVDFWENERLRREFCASARRQVSAHSMCRPLVERLCQSTKEEVPENIEKEPDMHRSFRLVMQTMAFLYEPKLSGQCMIDSAKLFMEVFADQPDLQKVYYSKHFPFMKELLEKNDRQALFKQLDDSRIEKMTVNLMDIYHYFKDSPVKSSIQKQVALLVLEAFKSDETLKRHGLQEMDLTQHSERLVSYLTLNRDAKLNRQELMKAFIQTMQACMCAPVVLNAKEEIMSSFFHDMNGLDKKEVKLICKRALESWSLEQTLPPTVTTPRRKL